MADTGCPNSTASGCRCVEHALGLMAHAPDLAAYAAALARDTKPVRLRVTTIGPARSPSCDGTMTCPCETCARERAQRPALGAGPAQFKPRPPRQRPGRAAA